MANDKGKNERPTNVHNQIEYRLVSQMKPNPKNPRKATKESIAKLAESIKENPLYFEARPILLSDRTGEMVIVGGEQRWKAATQLGMEYVPSILFHDLTEEREDYYMLLDNVHTGVWDEQKLQAWGKDQLQSWNVDGVKWPKQETEIKDDDFNPDKQVEARCVRGDIWQLGEHRLMCGDSTMPEDVTKMMAGERADMIFTDPPYGVDIKAVGNKQNRILGDLTQTAIPFSFDTACRFGLKPKAHLYFCGAEKNFAMYDKLFDRYLHNLPRHLIWVKNGFTMKRNGYHNQYEVIYFGYTEGAGDIWYGGRKEEDASDVWHINKDKASDYVHPTQKPIEIPARAIRNSSPVGGSVLDLFGGSGSTMIACEQLGRKCYMMELDPHYCDVIIARWEQYTGQKAIKIN